VTRIHLVRHGKVENPDSIRYGLLAGFHLSELGARQVAATARHVASWPIAAIVSSPLDRATETAAILAGALALPVAIEPRVIEAPSLFDGLPRTSFLRPVMWPRLANPLRPSWAEPFAAVARRMRLAILDLREAYRDREVVVVSHQGPIWLARRSFEARGPLWASRMRCGYASITTLEFERGRFVASHYWCP